MAALAIQLDGLVIVFFNGSGDTSYAAFDLDGYATNGSGYLLLGNAQASHRLLISRSLAIAAKRCRRCGVLSKPTPPISQMALPLQRAT